MTKDECTVVESIARKRGVSFDSFGTPKGHVVFLGDDLKRFYRFGNALSFVSGRMASERLGKVK